MIITSIRNLFIYLFIIGFFFFPNLQTVCVVLGFGLTFFVSKPKLSNKVRLTNHIGISMVLFFVTYLIGLLYSTDVNSATRALQNKIPFLIFPFFLHLIFSSNKERNFSYLKTFAISGVLYVLFSLLRASYIYLTEGSSIAFFTSDFHFQLHESQTMLLHPTYGAVYFNFLFFVSSIFYLNDTELFKQKNKLKLISILTVAIIFIVLSLSKLGFLMFIINVIVLMIFYAITKRKIGKTIIVFFSFLIVTAGVVYVSPLKIRFEQAVHEIFHGNQNPDDYYMSTGTRLWTWKVTNEIISENGFWGIGTGDFKNEIENKYREKKMVSFTGYDSHQQYLQTIATVGYLGLMFLVLMFTLIIYKSIKTKNILLLFLALMYVFWGFTESMFERQSGVLFFIFCVFLVDNLHIKKPSIEE